MHTTAAVKGKWAESEWNGCNVDWLSLTLVTSKKCHYWTYWCDIFFFTNQEQIIIVHPCLIISLRIENMSAFTWPDIVLKTVARIGLVCRNSSPCSESAPSPASPWWRRWRLGRSAAKHPVCRNWSASGQPPHRLAVRGGLLECEANLETRDIPLSTAVLVAMERGAELPAGQRTRTRGRIPGGEQRRWERGSAGNE